MVYDLDMLKAFYASFEKIPYNHEPYNPIKCGLWL